MLFALMEVSDTLWNSIRKQEMLEAVVGLAEQLADEEQQILFFPLLL